MPETRSAAIKRLLSLTPNEASLNRNQNNENNMLAANAATSSHGGPAPRLKEDVGIVNGTVGADVVA